MYWIILKKRIVIFKYSLIYISRWLWVGSWIRIKLLTFLKDDHRIDARCSPSRDNQAGRLEWSKPPRLHIPAQTSCDHLSGYGNVDNVHHWRAHLSCGIGSRKFHLFIQLDNVQSDDGDVVLHLGRIAHHWRHAVQQSRSRLRHSSGSLHVRNQMRVSIWNAIQQAQDHIVPAH